MKHLAASLVADLDRPAWPNEREGQPLPENRNMSGARDRQRIGLHLPRVVFDQDRTVIRTGAVGPATKISIPVDALAVTDFPLTCVRWRADRMFYRTLKLPPSDFLPVARSVEVDRWLPLVVAAFAARWFAWKTAK
jgi:hypothetical protein